MEPEMNPEDKNIEALVEAQARGEAIQGLPVENAPASEAELDSRFSKHGDIVDMLREVPAESVG